MNQIKYSPLHRVSGTLCNLSLIIPASPTPQCAPPPQDAVPQLPQQTLHHLPGPPHHPRDPRVPGEVRGPVCGVSGVHRDQGTWGLMRDS